MRRGYYETYNPVHIVSGIDSVDRELANELYYLGAKRILLLSDAGLDKLGVVDKVKTAIEAMDSQVDGVFLDIVEVTEKEINHICNIYRFNSCDSIVAVGGTSVINTAKAAKLVLSQEAVSIAELKGYDIAKQGKNLSLIVIPTTSGYGAELTNEISVKLSDGEYTNIVSQELFATLCILDAKMLEMLSAERILLYAYFSLSQIIESICAPKHTPVNKRQASFAISSITKNINECITEGKNVAEARQALLEASAISGSAVCNNMRGAIYSIAKAMSIVTGVGVSRCLPIILPVALRANMEMCREQYEFLLYYLVGSEEFLRVAKENRAEYFITALMNWFDSLAKKVGYKPRPIKITGLQMTDIVSMAYYDCASLANPVRVSRQYIFDILIEAIGGEI